MLKLDPEPELAELLLHAHANTGLDWAVRVQLLGSNALAVNLAQKLRMLKALAHFDKMSDQDHKPLPS